MNKTTITLAWDTNGRINHKITGFSLPSPRNDPLLWVLAPSVPLYMAHQLGTLKPSYGLFLSSQIIDISYHDKYVLAPINKTLKSAVIELHYRNDGSLGLQFSPNHSLIHNSDSLEEGARQLITNYYYYVYNMLAQKHQTLLRTYVLGVVNAYFSLIENAISANIIGPNLDRWNFEFSKWSQVVESKTSTSYSVPDDLQTDWIENADKKQITIKPELIDKHKSLCKKMDIM